MRNKYNFFILVIGLMILGAIFVGCYTQLDTAKNEDQDQDQNYSSGQDNYGYNESPDQNYYDDDYYFRSRSGFSYYYPPSYGYGFPSYSFNAAYNDPWGYGLGYNYYGSGYYGGGYYGSYYSPYGYYNYYNPYYYGYYSPSYYYRYGYTYATPGVHRIRDFGVTRGGATGGATVNGGGYSQPPDRGTSVGDVGTLPTGSSYDRSGVGSVRGSSASGTSSAPVQRRTANVRTNARGSSSQQEGVRTVRGMGSRGRSYPAPSRDAQASRTPRSTNGQQSPPPSYLPPAGSGNQPSRAPATTRSTPPPSGGQSVPSRSSGSTSRGRRP